MIKGIYVYCFIAFFALSACDYEINPKERQIIDNDESRCLGLIGPYHISIKRDYLFFWPSYEGESDWDANSKKTKKNCNSKIHSITFEVYYPDMLPAGHSTIGNDNKKEHMSLTYENRSSVAKPDLSNLLKFFTGLSSKSELYVIDDKINGLQHFSGLDSTLKRLKSDYYWRAQSGMINLIIECDYVRNGPPESCKQYGFIDDGKIGVEVEYSYEYLKQWSEIEDFSNNFFRQHVNF